MSSLEPIRNVTPPSSRSTSPSKTRPEENPLEQAAKKIFENTPTPVERSFSASPTSEDFAEFEKTMHAASARLPKIEKSVQESVDETVQILDARQATTSGMCGEVMNIWNSNLKSGFVNLVKPDPTNTSEYVLFQFKRDLIGSLIFLNGKLQLKGKLKKGCSEEEKNKIVEKSIIDFRKTLKKNKLDPNTIRSLEMLAGQTLLAVEPLNEFAKGITALSTSKVFFGIKYTEQQVNITAKKKGEADLIATARCTVYCMPSGTSTQIPIRDFLVSVKILDPKNVDPETIDAEVTISNSMKVKNKEIFNTV